MIEVKIINNINKKIEEYQSKTGTTKTWIAKEIGITKQAMYKFINADSVKLETLVKFAYVLKCKPEDLYEYKIKIVGNNSNINS